MSPAPLARPELTGVHGVPENALSDALLAALPRDVPGAPWDCRCSAVVWLERGGARAARTLAPALRAGAGLGVVGGLVRYESTPVGAYDEALALVAGRTGLTPWVSVPFMAVDSPASLVGGRTNWALPKSLLEVDGVPGRAGPVRARGIDDVPHGDWELAATARPIGPSVPVRTRAEMRQVFPDGTVRSCTLRAQGRVRPALVTVEVRATGRLGEVLRSGRRLGALVESAAFTLGTPSA